MLGATGLSLELSVKCFNNIGCNGSNGLQSSCLADFAHMIACKTMLIELKFKTVQLVIIDKLINLFNYLTYSLTIFNRLGRLHVFHEAREETLLT